MPDSPMYTAAHAVGSTLESNSLAGGRGRVEREAAGVGSSSSSMSL